MHCRSRFVFACLVMLLIACASSSRTSEKAATQANDKALVNVVSPPEKVLLSYFEHPQIEKYKQLIEKSYSELGIVVEFTRIEGERAYTVLDEGLVDGDVVAEIAVAERYTNIIIVQPALLTASVFLLCQPDIRCARDVLAEDGLSIFIDNVILNNMPKLLRDEVKAKFHVRSTTSQLLNMLRLGRVNYIIMGAEQEGLPDEQLSDLQNVKLFDIPAYHVVNAKHAALVPDLEQAISRQLAVLPKNNQ